MGEGQGPSCREKCNEYNEYNEFGEGSSNLCTGTLKQVLREAVRICKEDVVCKPVTHILTVS